MVKDDRYLLQLSSAERLAAQILVVEPDEVSRRRVVSLLREAGFGKVVETSTHAAALYKVEGRRFTHMVFSARRATEPVREWLAEIFEIHPELITIAITEDPSVDDVFSLLMEGSRGFLVRPFSRASLEYVVSLATKRDPLSDKVRRTGEPIAAILAMLMTSLDYVAIVRRQAKRFESARRDLVQAEQSLQKTAELFKLLTKTKQDELLSALQGFFIKKSSGPASPLGRLRKRLAESRDCYRE